ncbi:hypothetical protein TrLO_g12098 [Triparma laevis f. longispina]|uniref:Uncharacterized protein n=1 Tax=Triparma laevis f. longispina TaxID=1714387 RepID=A0A9W7FPW6_9STRA|nr:hypothetical protein TrLO_g12098 [Triparma laevis f. longispina]
MDTPAHHAVNSQFLHTPDFKRYFIHFVHNETLLNLMQTSKAWSHVADENISSNVKNGTMMVHDGKGKTEMRGETGKKTRNACNLPSNRYSVGEDVFLECTNLVPSNFIQNDSSAVVAYLRSNQRS